MLAPNEIRGLDLNGVDVVLSLGRPATCDDYLHVAGARRAPAVLVVLHDRRS